MKKSFILGAFIFCAGLIPVTPAHALIGETLRDATDGVQGVVQGVDSARSTVEQLKLQRTQEVETRRQAIVERITEKRAAIAEKLSGERQERCQKREVAINQVLDTRTNSAQKHLDRFKSIQEKLVAFVSAKGLDVENAAPLELIMNDKQTAAQAAVDAVQKFDFVCKEADAAAPGTIVIKEIAAAKQVLKDYRDAIKDYAIAVKSAATTVTQTEAEGNR